MVRESSRQFWQAFQVSEDGKERKKQISKKNNKRENSSCIKHNYAIGDKILVKTE